MHSISSYFQEADIAYNLFICRGTVFGESRGSANTTIRVYIWPRRKFVGNESGFSLLVRKRQIMVINCDKVSRKKHMVVSTLQILFHFALLNLSHQKKKIMRPNKHHIDPRNNACPSYFLNNCFLHFEHESKLCLLERDVFTYHCVTSFFPGHMYIFCDKIFNVGYCVQTFQQNSFVIVMQI